MSEAEVPAIWLEAKDDAGEQSFAQRHGSIGDGITVGTVLEYDDWQWAIVSELALDRDDPRVGFILLDEVGDDIIARLEPADGVRQHYTAVKHLRKGEHEYWTDPAYIVDGDAWSVLGPIHPDARESVGGVDS